MGAHYKTFVRLRPAKEPREHSYLEGSVIGANELWEIGAMLVPAPGDQRLPLVK